MLTSLLLKLFLAHLIGDFLFQSDASVHHKKKYKIKSKYLYWHIGIHLGALLLLLQFQCIPGVMIIVISHFFIDLLKLYLSTPQNSRLLFTADQIAHLFVLLGVAYYYVPFTINLDVLYTPDVLLFSAFLIFVTFALSVVIKLLIAPWDSQINTDQKSIDGAGKYIGILERLLVFGFVVLQIWSAVGFLLAAKSVFRFGDLTGGKDRKLTEYVLIGTLLSFGLAIMSGIIYNALATIIS